MPGEKRKKTEKKKTSSGKKRKKAQGENKELERFKVSLKDLLEAGCHFGHQSRRWNPKMSPYIYCARDGVHIFDLAQTSQKLAEACLVAKALAKEGKKIVFLGTKRQAQDIVKQEAKQAGMPFVVTRWFGGTISNWKQIKKSIEKLLKMKKDKEEGEYDKYTKKENILIDREIARLERFVGGLVELKKEPEALFVVDINREATAVREANNKGIKVFGIVDSNADPGLVDYPIPANDDAVRSIKLVVSTFARAIEESVALREKKEQSEK